jgi:carbon-monoxide dehydrogenase medium subunit
VSYDHHEPASVDEATDLLARYGDDAVAMAGATALVLLMKQGLVKPAHVVGLRRIDALRGIRADERGLWIGALTTHREAERSPAVRGHCAALADAFGSVATVRIREQATVGGNVAHADPAQDPPPMLIALDAVAMVAGRAGARRETPLDGFFVDQLATALAPGEVILGIRVPPLAAGARATYVKFLPGSQDDYATVSVAAALRMDGGRVADARVALGAVGPTPIRARAVEDALRGQTPSPERIGAAAALVRDAVDPISDHRGSAGYKREMARVWTERALRSLVA